jgi:glutaredoxin-like protein
MTLLNKPDQAHVREHLVSQMVAPVHLLTFIDSPTCQSCAATVSLLQEVAGLSDRVWVEVLERAAAPERAATYGVDKTPAIVVLAGADGELRNTRMRFFGVPTGYEVVSLIEAIVAGSKGEVRLAPATRAFLDRLDRPLHLQVFVTPTCRHCPRAVALAHRLALASPHMRADMVEVLEFPELAERYHVHGVPRTVINDRVAVEGAVPEGQHHARERGLPAPWRPQFGRHQ